MLITQATYQLKVSVRIEFITEDIPGGLKFPIVEVFSIIWCTFGAKSRFFTTFMGMRVMMSFDTLGTSARSLSTFVLMSSGVTILLFRSQFSSGRFIREGMRGPGWQSYLQVHLVVPKMLWFLCSGKSFGLRLGTTLDGFLVISRLLSGVMGRGLVSACIAYHAARGQFRVIGQGGGLCFDRLLRHVKWCR